MSCLNRATADGKRTVHIAMVSIGGMRLVAKHNRPKRRLRQRRPDLVSPCSRTDRGWTMEPPAMQLCGRTANPGGASKLIWVTTGRPICGVRRRWRVLQQDRRLWNGSQSPPMRRRPSDGWPRRSLAPARSTRSRREGRRMGQARGGGARCPLSGMADYVDQQRARTMPPRWSLAHHK